MTITGIPPSLRRRVLAEARSQCAYCHSLTDITGAHPVLDLGLGVIERGGLNSNASLAADPDWT
jgi:hypothetical protein